MVIFATSFSFANSIDYLVELGVYDILLPFLLIFAIVFAILEKTSIMGKDKTNINVIISIISGLLLVVQKGIVDTILLFMPRVSLMMVVILMGLLVISMIAGEEFKGVKGITFSVAAIVVIIAIIMALTSSQAGFGGIFLSQQDRDALLSIGLPLLILFGVIALVTAKPKPAGHPSTLSSLLKEIGGNLRGKE
jgi:hypothetical protein